MDLNEKNKDAAISHHTSRPLTAQDVKAVCKQVILSMIIWSTGLSVMDGAGWSQFKPGTPPLIACVAFTCWLSLKESDSGADLPPAPVIH